MTMNQGTNLGHTSQQLRYSQVYNNKQRNNLNDLSNNESSGLHEMQSLLQSQICTGGPADQTQSNQQYSGPSGKLTLCPYHGRSYVAYCSLHNELVCEECCDLSHHRDHNNQILLLKAAA